MWHNVKQSDAVNSATYCSVVTKLFQ